MMPSINEELEAIPTQRAHVYGMKGMLLLMPRTGLVVVPSQTVTSGYYCVVVKGNEIYPRGGHDILVSDREMLRAVEVEIDG